MATQSQELYDHNLSLQESVHTLEKAATSDRSRLTAQLVKELTMCVQELQQLVELCSQRAEGQELNVSLLLGFRCKFVSLSVCLFMCYFLVWATAVTYSAAVQPDGWKTEAQHLLAPGIQTLVCLFVSLSLCLCVCLFVWSLSHKSSWSCVVTEPRDRSLMSPCSLDSDVSFYLCLFVQLFDRNLSYKSW